MMEIRIKTQEEIRNSRVTLELTGETDEVAQAIDRIRGNKTSDPEKVWMSTSEVRAMNAKVTELEGRIATLTRGHVCTPSCEPDKHVAFVGRNHLVELEEDLDVANSLAESQETRINALEKSLAESRELVAAKVRVIDSYQDDLARTDAKVRELVVRAREYDKDRVTERDRADANRDWAERAEATAADMTGQRDRMVSDLNAQEARHAEERATANQALVTKDSLLTAAALRTVAAVSILAEPRVTEVREKVATSMGVLLAKAIGNALAALKPSTED